MAGAQQVARRVVLGVPDKRGQRLDDGQARPGARAHRFLLALLLGGEVPAGTGSVRPVMGGVALGQTGELVQERGDRHPQSLRDRSVRPGAVHHGDHAGGAVAEQGAAAEVPEDPALLQLEDPPALFLEGSLIREGGSGMDLGVGAVLALGPGVQPEGVRIGAGARFGEVESGRRGDRPGGRRVAAGRRRGAGRSRPVDRRAPGPAGP